MSFVQNKPAAEASFPITTITTKSRPAVRSRLRHISELTRITNATPDLVDGLIQTSSLACLVGAPGSGKSLLAMHIAACVATGADFHGRRCGKGLVVYLVGEGVRGASPRFQAIELQHSINLDDAPIVYLPVASSLLDSDEVDRLKAEIAEEEAKHGEKLALLVVDTLARYIAPGDESKAQDMTQMLNAVDHLRGEGAGLICHHPGHALAGRPRGSSALTAALETQLNISKTGDHVTVECSKMKDGDMAESMSLRLAVAATRQTDADGKPKTSAVLVPAGPGESMTQPRGKNQLRLLTQLRALARESAGSSWTARQLRAIARELGMPKNSASSAVESLIEQGYLTDHGGSLTLNGGDRSLTAVEKAAAHCNALG